MSKVVLSMPKGMAKNCVIGGAVALVTYVLMQLLIALLIHREVMGFDRLYPAVCAAAALASFLGCGWSVRRGKGSPAALTVSAVVVVFLTLTLAAALMTTDAIAMENGLTGIGLAMAAGGLVAALAGRAAAGKGGRNRSRKRRRA